jgi:hypothetical protein
MNAAPGRSFPEGSSLSPAGDIRPQNDAFALPAAPSR